MSPRKTSKTPSQRAGKLKNLFGVDWIPTIPFANADLPEELTNKTGGRMSISGVQKKAPVILNIKDKILEVAKAGSAYILKPDPERYPQLADVEDLCMDMAASLGFDVPPHAVLPMKDGTPAYIVKRFDRREDGSKIHKEDMVQLMMKPILSEDSKYESSLEAVGKLIKTHATNTYLDLLDFYERTLFNFVIGNGDMHLKNWALMEQPGDDGKMKLWLAPCYDFVSTRIYIGDEESALTINGKRNKIKLEDFSDFGAALGLETRVMKNSIAKITGMEESLLKRIKESRIAEKRKRDFSELLLNRISRLKEGGIDIKESGPKPEKSKPLKGSVPIDFKDWASQQRSESLREMDQNFGERRGFMELVSCLPSYRDRLNLPPADLFEATRRAEIRTFGWPIGIVLPNEPDRPVPTQDGVKALVRATRWEERSFDYWFLRRNGDFYLMQSLFEDQRGRNMIYFDTRIVRVTESILHQAQLYRAMNVPEKETIYFQFFHGGLKGRLLSAANASRILSTQSRTVESEVISEFQLRLADIESKLVDLVYGVVEELFSVFDFFKVSKIGIVEPLVKDFKNGTIR